VAEALDTGRELPSCPYGIDLDWKLLLAHRKLTSDGQYPSGNKDF
jgi:hypothetical protein